MAQANIDGELEAEFAAVAEQAGCEFVHAEFRGGTLRIFLDRPDGVTLEDCSAVSKEISALLDVTDFGRSRYTLEVSSPGLDRRLYGPRDYERFRGSLVRIRHVEAETRRKATIVGRLEEFRPVNPVHESELMLTESQSGRHLRIALGDVESARLEIELS